MHMKSPWLHSSHSEVCVRRLVHGCVSELLAAPAAAGVTFASRSCELNRTFSSPSATSQTTGAHPLLARGSGPVCGSYCRHSCIRSLQKRGPDMWSRPSIVDGGSDNPLRKGNGARVSRKSGQDEDIRTVLPSHDDPPP
jgi:hypothetical protein